MGRHAFGSFSASRRSCWAILRQCTVLCLLVDTSYQAYHKNVYLDTLNMSCFLHPHCHNYVCFFDSSGVVIKNCLKIMHGIYTLLKKPIILSKILSYFDSIFHWSCGDTPLVSGFDSHHGFSLPILAIWLVLRSWTISTGRSLSSGFLWLSLAKASPCTAITLLRCWRSRNSGNYWTKIARNIGTSCILYLPKTSRDILNNKDARIDRSTRKLKSLHSAGRIQHTLSKNDTADWFTLRRVSRR